MKWPNTVTVVRHGESAYNDLKLRKEADPTYKEFRRAYDRRKESADARKRAVFLAQKVLDDKTLILDCGDHDTPLTAKGAQQSLVTGEKLREREHPLPDVILASPFLRTRQTLANMAEG